MIRVKVMMLCNQMSICLNMIVRNERHVIQACLDSVKSLISYWVIHDTGSTDGTQKFIRKYLKGIPGELHEHKWVDFAHNRNLALVDAKSKADYLLFLDADEVWVYADDFKLPKLTDDVYYMPMRQIAAADTYRTALIKTSLPWKWKGVLHEILDCDQIRTRGTLEGVTNLCNTSKGARALDPQTRIKDAEVLIAELKKDPTNSRYMYYVGISYMAADKYDLAEKYFRQRVTMKSDDVEETYCASYNAGQCQERLGRLTEALTTFLDTSNLRPTRAEPLYRAAVVYRKQGYPLLGYLLSKYATTIPYPKGDACIEYQVYDHTALIEFANCALLGGQWREGLDASLKLIQNKNLPEEYRKSVQSNINTALQNLKELKN
jgi:glycosyltransferase involved in cell wall biosynthesis